MLNSVQHEIFSAYKYENVNSVEHEKVFSPQGQRANQYDLRDDPVILVLPYHLQYCQSLRCLLNTDENL